MATKPTQAERLLELLRERGEAGVTPLLALEELQCFRLASRVWDLREAGHLIETRNVATRGGAVVASYVLVEPTQRSLGL